MNYRVQIINASDPGTKWLPNGMEFVTVTEAIDYAKDLASRWTQVDRWRVVADDDTVVYPMNDYRAVALAEGFEEAETEEEVLLAWQHLHDSALGYIIQGSFGRTLKQMIKEGLIDA